MGNHPFLRSAWCLFTNCLLKNAYFFINSLRRGNPHMRQWPGSALVQVMASSQLCAKSYTQTNVDLLPIGLWKQKWNLNQITKLFLPKMCLKMAPILYKPQFVLCIPNTLQWRQNGRDGVSNHRRLDCLLNRLFRRRSTWSKNASKFRVTGLCEGIHRWPVDPPHKGPGTSKMLPFDDVIMITGSSWLVRCLVVIIVATITAQFDLPCMLIGEHYSVETEWYLIWWHGCRSFRWTMHFSSGKWHHCIMKRRYSGCPWRHLCSECWYMSAIFKNGVWQTKMYLKAGIVMCLRPCSQWETTLHWNAVSHWLGAYRK